MAHPKQSKDRIPNLRNPGDEEEEPCSPGSIEQELDMCEEGGLRGDEILHQHGKNDPEYSGDPKPLDSLVNTKWSPDLSEEDREGDEMSGDDHSLGLQGGEQEIENQSHIETGLPGDMTKHQELEEKEQAKSIQEKTAIPRVSRKKKKSA